jgi:hypothetical protein
MSQPIEPLEPRRHLAATPEPWRSVKAELDAAAGGTFKVIDTVVTDTNRTYLLGLIDRQIAVAALGPTGHIDPTFGGGVVRSPTGRLYSDGVVLELERHAVLTTDRTGVVYVATGTDVIKVRSNGKRDLSFGRRGVQTYAGADPLLRVQDVLATDDGRVLVATRLVRDAMEKFSLTEITPTQARGIWSARRNIGENDSIDVRAAQDAYLRAGGGYYWLGYRTSPLRFGPDTGGPYVPLERISNEFVVARFTPQLKFHDSTQIGLSQRTNITDVRLTRRGTVMEAVGNLELVHLDRDRNAMRRQSWPFTIATVPLQTRFDSEGMLWYAYQRYDDGARGIYFDHLGPDGTPIESTRSFRLNEHLLTDTDGYFNTFRVRPDSGTIVLTTGLTTQGDTVTRHIRPGVDGPSVSEFRPFRSYGGQYVSVKYTAPYGISKASIDQPRQPSNDLLITGPGDIQLVSGTSGFYRDGGDWWARYWINGLGESGVSGGYTVTLRDATVMDGLGVYNAKTVLGTFTYRSS